MIYQGKQKIWSDYQKEIPDDKWYYVRSCIRQNFFPASEKMFLVNDAAAAPSEEPPVEVILDRPFLYMLVETNTMTPLFMGVLGDID